MDLHGKTFYCPSRPHKPLSCLKKLTEKLRNVYYNYGLLRLRCREANRNLYFKPSSRIYPLLTASLHVSYFGPIRHRDVFSNELAITESS